MSKNIITIIFIILFLLVSSNQRKSLESKFNENFLKIEFKYLPPDYLIKLIAFGYDNALGDLFWMKSLQNMDVRNQHKRRFSYLYHILNIASTLQPHYLPIYTGGGGFLAIIYWDYEGAEKLFLKGIENFPENLQLKTFLSVLYMTDLQDFSKAAHYMNEASKTNGAPDWYKSLAARLYVEAERPEVAINMLSMLYRSEENEETKKEIARKIKLALIDKEILEINKKKIEYEKLFGDLKKIENLVEKGLIDNVPVDPFGQKYYLGPDGKVYTKSTQERFRPFLQERYRKKDGNN